MNTQIIPHLIIFTRYPEPGRTKTRLIPALGSVGAANLQRQMTEYTISKVKELEKTLNISWEIRFVGGNLALMREWLGNDLLYQHQGDGDLGQKMERSLVDAFKSGKNQVVIIGVDCPEINPYILSQALEKLKTCDLVIGPALDGGYYLIGLSRIVTDIFKNVSWGSSRVLEQTVSIAQGLKITWTSLPALADVDLPEDLWLWENIGPGLR